MSSISICKIHSFYNKVPFPRQRVQTTHSSLHRSVRIRSDLVTGWLIKSEREATLSVLIFTKRPGWRLSAVALQTMGVCLCWGGAFRGFVWKQVASVAGWVNRVGPTPPHSQLSTCWLEDWRTVGGRLLQMHCVRYNSPQKALYIHTASISAQFLRSDFFV